MRELHWRSGKSRFLLEVGWIHHRNSQKRCLLLLTILRKTSNYSIPHGSGVAWWWACLSDCLHAYSLETHAHASEGYLRLRQWLGSAMHGRAAMLRALLCIGWRRILLVKARNRERNTHTHTHTTVWRPLVRETGLPEWAGTRRNMHPLTPILIIGHPVSTSSIYYDP